MRQGVPVPVLNPSLSIATYPPVKHARGGVANRRRRAADRHCCTSPEQKIRSAEEEEEERKAEPKPPHGCSVSQRALS